MARKGLGKGLKALMPDQVESSETGASELDVDELRPNPYQPRQRFTGEGMRELVESIRQHGVVQPVLVRKEAGGYQIIAGERRWRAAQEAGRTRIPVLIKECSEQQMMEIALVENLQREDLNPLEEAMAYRRLLDEFSLTQENVAERVGKSRSQVTNTLRLLHLHPMVQEMLEEGDLSAGHARTLLAVGDGASQVKMARRVVKEHLNVRQLENMIRLAGRSPSVRKQPSADVQAVQERIGESLGTQVEITGEKKGVIKIRFHSPEDLERLLEFFLQTN